METERARLIAALRATGNPICIAATGTLPVAANAPYDLYLRSAGLDVATLRLLAPVLTAPLRAFSASYNPGLGDKGAQILAAALPDSVTELGLVGCAIGDAGATAILNWAG